MRCKSIIIKKYKHNLSNNDSVVHCAIDRPRTGFLGHNITNDDDYGLCFAHIVGYYGLAIADAIPSFKRQKDVL